MFFDVDKLHWTRKPLSINITKDKIEIKINNMIKQIVYWLVMCASLIGGMYIIYFFDGWFKLFSIILFGCFYGIFRQKITGKW